MLRRSIYTGEPGQVQCRGERTRVIIFCPYNTGAGAVTSTNFKPGSCPVLSTVVLTEGYAIEIVGDGLRRAAAAGRSIVGKPISSTAWVTGEP